MTTGTPRPPANRTQPRGASRKARAIGNESRSAPRRDARTLQVRPGTDSCSPRRVRADDSHRIWPQRSRKNGSRSTLPPLKITPTRSPSHVELARPEGRDGDGARWLDHDLDPLPDEPHGLDDLGLAWRVTIRSTWREITAKLRSPIEVVRRPSAIVLGSSAGWIDPVRATAGRRRRGRLGGDHPGPRRPSLDGQRRPRQQAAAADRAERRTSSGPAWSSSSYAAVPWPAITFQSLNG